MGIYFTYFLLCILKLINTFHSSWVGRMGHAHLAFFPVMYAASPAQLLTYHISIIASGPVNIMDSPKSTVHKNSFCTFWGFNGVSVTMAGFTVLTVLSHAHSFSLLKQPLAATSQHSFPFSRMSYIKK